MLKYLGGWFSSTDAELQNAVLCIPQSADSHFSCTIFGIYISHTGLANKERARAYLQSPSQSPPSLCLFLFASICPSAPCSHTFFVSSLLENVAAGASSRPALIYCTGVCAGIYSSFPACTLLFHYLTRTFMLKRSVSVILSF